jgi:O-antigen ligase
MKILDKTIEYGLYLLVFLLPLQTRWIIKAGEFNSGYLEYGTYSLYLTDILLIFILILFITRYFVSGYITGNKNQSVSWLVWGLILTSAISVFFATDKLLGVYKLSWLMLGAGLFWLLKNFGYEKLKLIYSMLFGVFFSVCLGIWQFLTQASFQNKWFGLAIHQAGDLGTSVVETVNQAGVGERWLRAYGSMDHPNIFGGMIAVAMILLILEILKTNNHKILKILNWFIILIFTAGLFFSFSRSAWLAFIFGLGFIVALTVVKKNLKGQKSLAEIILVMGITIFILFNLFSNLVIVRLTAQGRLENKSQNERLVSYQESWQIIKNNLFFGSGIGNYIAALMQEIKRDEPSYFYQPVPNIFLLLLSEIGVVGLIFFISFLIAIFVQKNSNKSILITLIILTLFDHWLWSLHFGILFFWLLAGLIIVDNFKKT